jgi:hypothetical protein
MLWKNPDGGGGEARDPSPAAAAGDAAHATTTRGPLAYRCAPSRDRCRSGEVLAGDDPGDRLDDLGQLPPEGAGEAVAAGSFAGGDRHQHDRG